MACKILISVTMCWLVFYMFRYSKAPCDFLKKDSCEHNVIKSWWHRHRSQSLRRDGTRLSEGPKGGHWIPWTRTYIIHSLEGSAFSQLSLSCGFKHHWPWCYGMDRKAPSHSSVLLQPQQVVHVSSQGPNPWWTAVFWGKKRGKAVMAVFLLGFPWSECGQLLFISVWWHMDSLGKRLSWQTWRGGWSCGGIVGQGQARSHTWGEEGSVSAEHRELVPAAAWMGGGGFVSFTSVSNHSGNGGGRAHKSPQAFCSHFSGL